MKTILPLLAIVIAIAFPLYLYVYGKQNADLTAMSSRLIKTEADLTQAQADIGEMKQQMQLVLRRGQLPD
jgi:hypothetical protein